MVIFLANGAFSVMVTEHLYLPKNLSPLIWEMRSFFPANVTTLLQWKQEETGRQGELGSKTRCCAGNCRLYSEGRGAAALEL